MGAVFFSQNGRRGLAVLLGLLVGLAGLCSLGLSWGEDAPLSEGQQGYNRGVELFQLAQLQGEKGDAVGQKSLLKEAIATFQKALSQDNTLVDAQSNIGFAYLTLKDYKQAVQAFQAALVINPNHLNTLNGLATAYAFSGKIPQALEVFQKLTTLDPGNPQFFFNQGSILQKAGRFQEAKTAYETAIRLYPEDQRALFNLATLYENAGKPQEAEPYYEKAKNIAIDTPIGLESVRRLEALKATHAPADPARGQKPNQ